MQDENEEKARERVWGLIKDIKTALMVTHGGEGLRSRPMAALHAGTRDRELWFMTRAESGKVDEVEHDGEVLLAFSEPKDQNYVSIYGKAHIVRDRAKIRELWSEPLRTWFPQGQDDPHIALIHVHPSRAEYWDVPSSALIYAYGYVKARLTGETPDIGKIGKVAM